MPIPESILHSHDRVSTTSMPDVFKDQLNKLLDVVRLGPNGRVNQEQLSLVPDSLRFDQPQSNAQRELLVSRAVYRILDIAGEAFEDLELHVFVGRAPDADISDDFAILAHVGQHWLHLQEPLSNLHEFYPAVRLERVMLKNEMLCIAVLTRFLAETIRHQTQTATRTGGANAAS